MTTLRPPSDTPTASGQSFLVTFVVILCVIAALFTFDTFLARVDRAESRAQATHLFLEGEALVRANRNREAVDRFRSALFIARGERAYQLALARALGATGKPADAERILAEMLQRDATDAAANLEMARVLVEEERIAQAISFYHRAIYGQWKGGSSGRLTRARFELIDLLAKQGSSKELLAELLPIQAEGNTDVAVRKRLGTLFIVAGSPERAAAIFRGILRERPRDPEAHAGIGEAALAAGNYRIAQANLLTASQLDPTNEAIRQRLALVNRVRALDPMQRGLGPGEQLRRSRLLVELATAVVERCAGPGADSVKAQVDSARTFVQRRVRSGRQVEAFDATLDRAERLWALRGDQCGETQTRDEEAAALVLAKVAQ